MQSWPVASPTLTPVVPPAPTPPGLDLASEETSSPGPEAVRGWPWRALLALGLALLGQQALEPPERSVSTGVIFYLLAGALIVWASTRGEWQLGFRRPKDVVIAERPIRFQLLLFGLPFAALAYWAYGNYLFTPLNLLIWVLALVATAGAFWVNERNARYWFERLRLFFSGSIWKLSISPWTLLFLAGAIVVIFFRVYRLAEVPPEMISDHAEKLLDVADVLDGQPHVFFPRNTGREALQIYLTAAVATFFDMGLSFLSLKLGTTIAGLLTLPFVYLLGKEVANPRVGFYALVFAGIAYWPNVTSRIALRFSLFALFVAPTLYYLLRGLRTGRRNEFILSGIAVGLGLHGYSPFRIVPFLVLAGVGIFWFHQKSKIMRQRAIWGLLVLGLVAFVVFLPLLRYAVDNPEMFSYRTLTRLGSLERPLPGPAWEIFLQNFWDASVMFFWSNGGTWVHSVANRPALDVISATLYASGVILLLWRYLRQRQWIDLFLLLTVPVLLLPSILSLAFPDENPALNRTTGAWVPVFLIVGLSFDGLLQGLRKRIPGNWGSLGASFIGLALIFWSASLNYDLVFNQYTRQYQLASWNTSEVGRVVRAFADSVGTRNTAWVVGYPHWVDTRLVGINAGFPRLDNAIWPEQLETTREIAGPKLFVLKPEHQEALDILRTLYPDGQLRYYNSLVENKNFLMYFVPP